MKVTFKIFCGNIPFEATEDEIRSLFAPFGEIHRLRLPPHRDSVDLCAGYAFIDFADSLCASRAIEQLNGTLFQGRRLRVEFTRPHPERDRRSLAYGD